MLSQLDMVERFQIGVNLCIVAMQNIADQGASSTVLMNVCENLARSHVQILESVLMVMMSEVLVDWIKHAFITKFNLIEPKLYDIFFTIVSRDIVASHNAPVCTCMYDDHYSHSLIIHTLYHVE